MNIDAYQRLPDHLQQEVLIGIEEHQNLDGKETEKARRYVDSPNEVPEGYEVEQGPQGGIYYETDETDAEAGAGDHGIDELREMVDDSSYVVTEGVSVEDISVSHLGPFIVDRGNGPEIVQAAGVMEIEGERKAYFGDPNNFISLDDIEVYGRIKPKRDEYGHLINPETAEVEQPDSHDEFPTRTIRNGNLGDWWNDPDAAHDGFRMMHQRLRKAYGKGEGSTSDDVWGSFQSWQRKGYNGISELWEAAMAMTGKETVPEHLTNYSNHGIGDTDPETLQALCDVIRASRETARDEFGESITVYRAIDGRTFRQYATETEDGVEIKPNIMESWSVDEEGAQNWADHKAGSGGRFSRMDAPNEPDYVFVEKEFSPEDVAYHGALSLARTNVSYKELTMAPQDETYTIPEEQIDRTHFHEDGGKSKQDRGVTPRMPWYASNWMFEFNEELVRQDMAESTKDKLFKAIDAFKARRYVNSPEEVPEGYEVQQGPQGGLYYETGDDEEEEETGELNVPPEEEEWQDIDPEDLEEGEYVWVETRDGPVLAQVEEGDYGLEATPVQPGDERGLSITGLGGYDVIGMAEEEDAQALLDEWDEIKDEGFGQYEEGEDIVFENENGEQVRGSIRTIGARNERAKVTLEDGSEELVFEDEVVGSVEELMGDDPQGEPDFEDLQMGQEIVIEDYKGNTKIAEVSNLWEDSNRDNITAIDEDGNEHAVLPEDYVGVPEDQGTGLNVATDDLTGQTVKFETGEKGYVIDGEGQGLHVELLQGPNAGEDIYGVKRDSIEDVVDDDFDADLEDGWTDVPDVGGAPLDEAKGWIKGNTYFHQNLKVYDRANGEVRDAFVSEKDHTDIEVQVKGGDKESYYFGSRGDSNRFEIIGAEEFDSLSDDEKHDALVKTFQNTNFMSIDYSTEGKVQENFFGRGYDGSGSLRNAKSWETQKRIAEGMSYLKNKVKRASCGGNASEGTYYIKVSKDESEETIAHELGHGIANTFGYDYTGQGQDDDYHPRELSHNFTDHTDTGTWNGFIDWDLGDDSPFYEPEEYMLSKWGENGNTEDRAVGFDSFKEEVEKEVKQRYKDGEIVLDSWEAADYENPDEDATARQVFDSLNEGDLVRFNTPDWDAGKDEDGEPLETEHEHAAFSHIEETDAHGVDRAVAMFERPNGDMWRWPLTGEGELNSDWSSVDAVSIDPAIPDEDEDSDNTDSGGIPAEQRADSVTEHLAERWEGFNGEADSSDAKADNLMRAVNRAWYKQAKVHEATDDPLDRQSVVMETGYSATNSHETIAQLHEVMQTPTDSNKKRANDIFDEHPYLVLAYLDMWEPSPEMMEEMQELLQALGIEI